MDRFDGYVQYGPPQYRPPAESLGRSLLPQVNVGSLIIGVLAGFGIFYILFSSFPQVAQQMMRPPPSKAPSQGWLENEPPRGRQDANLPLDVFTRNDIINQTGPSMRTSEFATLSGAQFYLFQPYFDANSMFAAMSDQLYHDFGDKYNVVRESLCKFMASSPTVKQMFQRQKSAGLIAQSESFQSRVNRMTLDSQQGERLELEAMALGYKRRIVVLCTMNETSDVECGNEYSEPAKDVYLARRVVGGAYQYFSLRRKMAGKDPMSYLNAPDRHMRGRSASRSPTRRSKSHSRSLSKIFKG